MVGDRVRVLYGTEKGKYGVISRILHDKNQVVVNGTNLKRSFWHPEPGPGKPSRVTVELPIHVTNVALIDPVTKQPTRVKRRYTMNGEGVRISKPNSGDMAGVALAKLLETNQVLQQLELQGNAIFTVGVQALAEALPKNRSLQHLDLSHNQLGIGGAELLSSGLHQSSLTSLNLSGNRICGRGAGEVLRATRNTGVVFLDLARNEIGPQGLELMCAALEDATISSLSLANNRLQPEDAPMLCESCCKCEALQVNDLGLVGAQHLSEMLPKSKLTALDLTGNSIGDGGKTRLAALGLGHNSITDEGVKVFCAAKWGSLQSLELMGNAIGDSGAELLKSSVVKEPQLQVLDLLHLGGPAGPRSSEKPKLRPEAVVRGRVTIRRPLRPECEKDSRKDDGPWD
eukprot:g71.t1